MEQTDGLLDIYAWIGSKASVQERKHALFYAEEYLQKYNRPLFLPISRVVEGGESKLFIDSFDV